MGVVDEPVEDGVGEGGRRDVEPDDGVQLLSEGGVVGELEAAPAMRREAVCSATNRMRLARQSG